MINYITLDILSVLLEMPIFRDMEQKRKSSRVDSDVSIDDGLARYKRLYSLKNMKIAVIMRVEQVDSSVLKQVVSAT